MKNLVNENKVLAYLFNHSDSISDIANRLGADDFSLENRELFTKIYELRESKDLFNDLCKLNLTKWNKRNLDKLRAFNISDVDDSIEYLIEQSLPFNKKIPQKLLTLEEHSGNGKITLINAKELQTMELKPINWVIKDLLPEGLLILAGRPKIGKSFLALNMSLAITNGGHALGYFKANKNSVLYIPYEDNYRRLQDRINRMLAEEHYNEAPPNLFIPKDCDFPKMTIEGIDTLGKILDGNENIKLVVIDTLGRAIVRSNKRNANQFQDEYDFGASLQKIALQRHISILLVHHTTKMKYEDGYDSILGTTGLTASPDSLMLLSKDSNKEFTLSLTGRDIEEKEYSVKFQNCIWIIEGEKGKTTTPEREEIISFFIRENRPLKTKEIAVYLDKSENNVCNLLKKIPEIVKVKYGEYALNDK